MHPWEEADGQHLELSQLQNRCRVRVKVCNSMALSKFRYRARHRDRTGTRLKEELVTALVLTSVTKHHVLHQLQS